MNEFEDATAAETRGLLASQLVPPPIYLSAGAIGPGTSLFTCAGYGTVASVEACGSERFALAANLEASFLTPAILRTGIEPDCIARLVTSDATIRRSCLTRRYKSIHQRSGMEMTH
eukprot:s3230_g7.t1